MNSLLILPIFGLAIFAFRTGNKWVIRFVHFLLLVILATQIYAIVLMERYGALLLMVGVMLAAWCTMTFLARRKERDDARLIKQFRKDLRK